MHTITQMRTPHRPIHADISANVDYTFEKRQTDMEKNTQWLRNFQLLFA